MVQERKNKQTTRREGAEEAESGKDVRNEELTESVDDVLAKIDEDLDEQDELDILADIDDVLEENAAEFVKEYIQQGGQ